MSADQQLGEITVRFTVTEKQDETGLYALVTEAEVVEHTLTEPGAEFVLEELSIGMCEDLVELTKDAVREALS